MVAWLKYFFLGFFYDKYTKNAEERNFGNTALAVFLAFVILCMGLFLGYICSFPTHIDNASQFKAFLSESLDGVQLKIEDGKLSASASINDFAGLTDGNKLDGYGLIVETGPTATTFDDFSVICRASNGNEIPYSEYVDLSENEKSNYTPQLLFSGRRLDVTIKQEEYKSVLGQTKSGALTIADLDDKKDSGAITDKEYADEIYIAYVKAYYPPMDQVEKHGRAPTLRTYFLGLTVSDFSDKYIMLLDDMCIGSFVTDNNVKVEFEGYYADIADGNITDITDFIIRAFRGGIGYNLLLNIINMFRFIAILIVAMLIIALALFIIYRLKAQSLKIGYFGSLKIVGAYLFISSVFASVFAIVMSFFYAKSTAQLFALISCIAVLLFRSLAKAVMQVLEYRKQLQACEEGEADVENS